MLTTDLVEEYDREGFIVWPAYLDNAEVEVLLQEFERLVAVPSPELIYEADGKTVRGHHGAHQLSEVYAELVRLPRLLGVAEQVLNSAAYIHQFKINAKRALEGDLWEWHQDFQFWHAEDAMPQPHAVNFGIFFDEVTEFNGPLTFVPGSHESGLVDVQTRPDTSWEDTLASQLRYRITPETLKKALNGREMIAPKGPRGTVVMFKSTVLHASAPNMSPFDRRMVVLTYNSVENPLAEVQNPRPEFVASRDFTPLEAGSDDALRNRASYQVGSGTGL